MKRFSELFFQKKMPNGPPNSINNLRKSVKTRLETKSIKHVENVLNLMPSDLPKTCFRMEKLQKVTKTRGADKYNKIPKNNIEMKPTSMNNWSRQSTKTEKTNPANQQKTQQMTPKWVPKNEVILGVAPLGAPLVAQTAFGHQK